jgi:hypothetical protein
LGADPVMLSGNIIAIVASGIIHWIHSTFIDRTVFDFATLDEGITLVEEDQLSEFSVVQGLAPDEVII